MASFGSTLSKLNAGGLDIKIAGFSVNVPSLNVTLHGAEGSSIGSLVASPGSLVQTMTAGARGIFCIGAILTDPSLLLSTLQQCYNYILLNGLELINDIYKTCIARINNILHTVYGITLSVFRTIKNVMGALKGIVDLVDKLWDYWNNFTLDSENKLFKKKDCDFFIANLMRCMMNKLLQPYLEKFKNKVEQEINDATANIPDDITNTANPLTSMTTYLDNQTMFVNKFTTQVENLL